MGWCKASIVQKGLALIHQSSMPLSYWHYAMSTSIYLMKILPNKILNNLSPYELLFGKLLDYTILKTFGAQCFLCLNFYTKHKLQARFAECVFIGYASHHHDYLCLDKLNRRVYISRHVIFNEHVFPFASPIVPSNSSEVSSPILVPSALPLLSSPSPPSQPTFLSPTSSPM